MWVSSDASNGVGLRMAAAGAKSVEVAGQVSGSLIGQADDRVWVGSCR